METIQIVVKQQQGRDISEEEAQEMYDEKARLFGLMPDWKPGSQDGVPVDVSLTLPVRFSL